MKLAQDRIQCATSRVSGVSGGDTFQFILLCYSIPSAL
jgi:hypothetical protein